MPNSKNQNDANTEAEASNASDQSFQKKFLIRQADQTPTGPYHWKLLVEWYELGLIDEFSFEIEPGEYRPISELVRAYGIPPTIGINSIFLAPTDGAPKCSKSFLTELQQLGFPEIKHPVNQEQAEHIAKRLKLSDEALDLEDPTFTIKSATFVSETAPSKEGLEEEATADEPPADEPPADEPPADEPPAEDPPAEDPLAAEAVVEEVTTVEPSQKEQLPENTPAKEVPVETQPDSIKELLKGDLISENDDSEDEKDEPAVHKKSNNFVILILVAILILGGVIAYFMSVGSEGSEQNKDVDEVEMPPS